MLKQGLVVLALSCQDLVNEVSVVNIQQDESLIHEIFIWLSLI
tara:strand:- start:320 stop:448 length:129 start_codon:yes stop_codon:yes gene_type:complete